MVRSKGGGLNAVILVTYDRKPQMGSLSLFVSEVTNFNNDSHTQIPLRHHILNTLQRNTERMGVILFYPLHV